MASETVKLFSKIELEVIASAAGTFTVLTDEPGDAMAQRFSFTVPASGANSQGLLLRRTVRSRLPYNTQGHLVQAIYKPGTGQTLLYRARVWARELPGGQWQWYVLPVIETPVEFTAADLPIPPTPEEWSPTPLPIPPTPEEWKPMALPIPPTTEEWNPAPLPIPPTPEEWKPAALPIPPTPEQWGGQELPIKPTPDVPGRADLEIDQ